MSTDYIALLKQSIERRLERRGKLPCQFLIDENEEQLRHDIARLEAAELEVSVS